MPLVVRSRFAFVGQCGGGCAAMFVFSSGMMWEVRVRGCTGELGRLGPRWEIEKSRRDRELRDAEIFRDGRGTSGLHTRSTYEYGWCGRMDGVLYP